MCLSCSLNIRENKNKEKKITRSKLNRFLRSYINPGNYQFLFHIFCIFKPVEYLSALNHEAITIKSDTKSIKKICESLHHQITQKLTVHIKMPAIFHHIFATLARLYNLNIHYFVQWAFFLKITFPWIRKMLKDM